MHLTLGIPVPPVVLAEEEEELAESAAALLALCCGEAVILPAGDLTGVDALWLVVEMGVVLLESPVVDFLGAEVGVAPLDCGVWPLGGV